MGQRHQGFIKVKKPSWDKGEKTIGSHTVGFHHQWLYGKTAVQQVRNILEFNFKASQYHAFSSDDNQLGDNEMEQMIFSLAGMNVKYGYHHNVISLNDENSEWENSLKPDCQDNNDGQHFIDFTVKGKPKFCFAFPFNHDIYDDNDKVIETIPMWKPISARDYFALYYSQEEIDKANTKQDIAFFKSALRDIKWIENHTKFMNQDELYELYPHLKA